MLVVHYNEMVLGLREVVKEEEIDISFEKHPKILVILSVFFFLHYLPVADQFRSVIKLLLKYVFGFLKNDFFHPRTTDDQRALLSNFLG